MRSQCAAQQEVRESSVCPQLQYNTIQHKSMQYNAIPCNTTQYNTMRYNNLYCFYMRLISPRDGGIPGTGHHVSHLCMGAEDTEEPGFLEGREVRNCFQFPGWILSLRRLVPPHLPYIRPQDVSYRVTPENDSGPSGASWILTVGVPTPERLAPGLSK